ncbi:209_t:CDS:2 [Gigaspora margarita]|uniref:209_t:CDS:1 n=1 Tax=Gigaspora margarita TaxID=4874 RepID=A0ABN7UDW0_GIGMA|nr:209_t:CDS:2 [Gigaspora margarita]
MSQSFQHCREDIDDDVIKQHRNRKRMQRAIINNFLEKLNSQLSVYKMTCEKIEILTNEIK